MEDEKKPRKDKRSERTRLLISDALQALLQKSVFSGITVNDICIQAEVSRATFYLYFVDKFQLLHFTIQRWGGAIREMADPEDLESLVNAILETLYAHRREINNTLVADRNEEVQGMIHTGFAKTMLWAFEKQQAAGVVLHVPAEVLSVFCAGGFTYAILWWLEGRSGATRQEMCDHLVRIARGTAVEAPAEVLASPT